MQSTPAIDKSPVYLLFQLLISLSRNKYTPDTTNIIQGEYDYIIVGAGSAGSTVASRLSEVPCISVLLLEAGPSPPVFTEVPALLATFVKTDIDWGFSTVPQKYTARALINKQLYIPSGKTIGGTSVINTMIYVRGARQIFDQWGPGWKYKDVLRYFKKMEMNRNPDSVEKPYHGFSGPMTVERPIYQNEFKSVLKEAISELGYKFIDVNGQRSKGFYDYQQTTRNGQRCSTGKAYLLPAENRRNLDIVKFAFVKKIIIENQRAVGVHVDIYGKTYDIRARKEVILSAGTLNTPKLLMLSGIGPKAHLQEKNISLVADLPVGLNFQDHIASIQPYYTDDIPPSESIMNVQTMATYLTNRTGPLSAAENYFLAFLTNKKHTSSKSMPDYQLHLLKGSSKGLTEHLNIKPKVVDAYFKPYESKSQLWCLAQILHPKSRGTVKLRSNDPYGLPLIDPNYLENTEDIVDMVSGMKTCDKIFGTRAAQAIGLKPFKTHVPGCNPDKGSYRSCVARNLVLTTCHPVGTAKMGNRTDPTAVVDRKLRVKGIAGLRVVDASVMPVITAGNTNAPTIMIGEKAADMIKKRIDCQTSKPDDNS